MAPQSQKRLSDKQVLEGVVKMIASLKDARKDAKENRAKQISLAKKHFGARFSDQGEATAKYVEELSNHFRKEMAIIESELAAGAARLSTDKRSLQTAHNFIKRAEWDIDRLDVKEADHVIDPDEEALLKKLKGLIDKNPRFLPILLEGEPGTDYITKVEERYDEIKAQLDSAKEMISKSCTEISERFMGRLHTDVLPRIQQSMDEGRSFAQGEAEAFSELRNSYDLEKAQLEEEIQSLRENKEHTEAALADLRERSTTKQRADRMEIEQLQAAIRRQDNEMETTKREHEGAIHGERDPHSLAMERTRREHVQAMDAARVESDRRLRESSEEHAQAMAKTRAEHAQTLENAETRSTTKSKIIASNLSVLHRSDADAEERINELCELFEGMQGTATQQLSPDLFPDDRRLDSTNTVMEEGLTLVAGDSGALFLFDKHSGTYMFRAEDLDHVSVATYKLMLVFRGDLCLPERLRSIALWDGVAETWDFVLDWRLQYLEGMVSKYEE